MFKRNVIPLSEVLQRFLRDNGLETPLQQKRLIDSWEKIAGKAVARYTQEKFIRNQTLFVKISNPALRADLSMMREELMNRLNQEVGSRLITEIRFY
jgi:predicted nucleic acid-binding Zn ribbon protein